MLGKTEDKRRRGVTEDEMVGWHHQLNGHESEQSPGSQRVGHDLATEQPPPQFPVLWLLSSSDSSLGHSSVYTCISGGSWVAPTLCPPPQNPHSVLTTLIQLNIWDLSL